MKRNRPLLLLAFVSIVCICGCGGGGPDVTDSRSVKNDARGGLSAPAAPQARQAKLPNPEPSKANSENDDAVTSADPADVFRLADGEPNFEIVDDGADTFLASVPPSGVDSSQFTLLPLKTDKSSANPAARNFQLPAGFLAVVEAGYSANGFPNRILCEKDGSVMALISSSISTQGTNNGSSNARPQLAVFLDPYYIDIAEVTLAQYSAYRAWWKKTKKRTLNLPVNASSPDDYPALGVSWADARNYAISVGKQLPTEAEWEKAARGPEGFVHPWGNGRAGWSPARTLDQIDPVASFRADISPYGVFDLAGNAREWCADFYSDTAYQEATKNGASVVRNWTGPKRDVVQNHRVVKGNGPGWMAWHRSSVHMRESASNVGFRCVLRGFPAGGEERK